ncbi:phage portal protein family protein [Treponema phagedenis]|uniref:phage portal protein family protein n=1 Tax=Treponema phagedenis TaxID=162 RepID=UPI003EBAD6FA
MCYWPWRFKQFGWEFWLKAAKKAGVPSIVALFESTNTEEARNAAQAISQNPFRNGRRRGLSSF